ncbi:hypothetical protein IMY05_006G0148700 [Salix suchowensis]|nr:hypothetical protein IMY05_006G0148700 [Salix suchowensis]
MQGRGRSKGHLWLLPSSNLVLTLLILGIVDLGISFVGISMFSGWQRTASVSSSQDFDGGRKCEPGFKWRNICN